MGEIRHFCVEGLNWLEGVELEEEERILMEDPSLVPLFEVEVDKVMEKYLQRKVDEDSKVEDEDYLLYEEEYVLWKSVEMSIRRCYIRCGYGGS
jgi:hypothetical protein